MNKSWLSHCALAALVAAGVVALASGASAQSVSASTDVLVAKPADPSEKGDGTMGPAARAAFRNGPLPIDAAKLKAAKDAAQRAYEEALRAGKLGPTSPQGPARAPSIVGGTNFEGQFDSGVTPSDSTGSVGTTRYIQLVNEIFGIYNKTSTTPLATGTLDNFAGVSSSVASFDPQVIWDAKTKRFYYVMDSIFSASDNRLSFGFSKTASPSSAADFCHYTLPYGVPFPDYPKLGDNKDFAIIGVNTFSNNTSSGVFVGSDLLAGLKPPSGTSCPASLTFTKKANLKDISGFQVFTPVPASEVDDGGTGYAIARNGGLPSTQLWLFTVKNDGAGNPKFGKAKSVTVTSYTFPPNAAQGGGFTQVMDTLDARNTQAVVAKNPARGNALSFWTQHTIANGVLSGVRWYEIDPTGPTVLRSGTVAESGNFLYNGAISPDRQVKGSTKQFGDSFVIGYTKSSQTNNINPGNAMVSSLHGGAVSAGVTVKAAGGPYRDFFCPNPGNVCRWGDYAAASPDPDPAGSGTGNVWLTNQFAGGGTSTSQANWRTEIWRAKP